MAARVDDRRRKPCSRWVESCRPGLSCLGGDLGEEGGQVDVDGGAGEFETFGGLPVGSGGDATGAGCGVDDPDGFDAHGAIVLAAFFEVGVGVVGGEDFNDQKWWVGEDFLLGAGAEDDKVGDADAFG